MHRHTNDYNYVKYVFFIRYNIIRLFSKDILFNMIENSLKSMYIHKLQDKKFLRLKLNAQKILKY